MENFQYNEYSVQNEYNKPSDPSDTRQIYKMNKGEHIIK